MQAVIFVLGADPDLVDFLQRVFMLDGFSVYAACDRKGVQDLFAVNEPQLVIVELTSLGDDGLSILCLVRSRSQNPVLVLARPVQASSVRAAFELGADAYLAVPFKPTELRRGCRALLSGNRNWQIGNDGSQFVVYGTESHKRWLQALDGSRKLKPGLSAFAMRALGLILLPPLTHADLP